MNMYKLSVCNEKQRGIAKQLRRINPKGLITPITLGLVLGLQVAQAEDPLLGRIKAIKCVGCEQGKVTLVMHDPIEVRDFDITITDVDYGKIITPLPGKVVYEGENSCFYWNEAPKIGKADKAPPVAEKKTALMNSAQDKSQNLDVKSVDSTALETPIVEVNKSKCIPYLKAKTPKTNPSN